MNNKSYQHIFDEFNKLFPEFKPSVKEWDKVQFDSEMRIVRIMLKNGCYIFFGTTRDPESNEWTWVANLDMSDKTKEKLGVTLEEE